MTESQSRSECDPPHQLHHRAAKRRRLNEDPASWPKQTEEQIEELRLQLSTSSFHQASSDPRLAPPATRNAFFAPEPWDLPARANLNTVSSVFETTSTRPDFNGQLSSQAFRLGNTHGLPRGDTYGTQPAASWCQPGPCSRPSSTYSQPANIPIPPPASWTHHAVHPQLVQARSLTFVPIPYYPYPVASLQAPRNSQQSSDPPSVETPPNEAGIDVVDDSASSVSVRLDNEPVEMVCFGMVSRSKLHHKSVRAEHLQVTAISARCGRQSSCDISSPFPIQIDSSDRFSLKDRPTTDGSYQNIRK